jgi:hypothetical protein
VLPHPPQHQRRPAGFDVPVSPVFQRIGMNAIVGKRHQRFDICPQRQRRWRAVETAAIDETRKNLPASAAWSRHAAITGAADKTGRPRCHLEIGRFTRHKTIDAGIAFRPDMQAEIVDGQTMPAGRHLSSHHQAGPAGRQSRCLPPAGPWPRRPSPGRSTRAVRPRHNGSCGLPRETSPRHPRHFREWT